MGSVIISGMGLALIFLLFCSVILLLVWQEWHRKTSTPSTGVVRNVWQGSERRVATRYAVPLLVSYRLPNGHAKRHGLKTQNVSATGMCLLMLEKLRPGTTVEFIIALPEPARPGEVRGQGTIVWTRRVPSRSLLRAQCFLAGIKFVELSPPGSQAIVASLEQATTRPQPAS
ncbi:MAG: PilZ domain-containing protein [Candidatus Omnitrophica bacterium]|nr:PilZ domain-containing protein [Candidatus Omnitrophota bacterium]